VVAFGRALIVIPVLMTLIAGAGALMLTHGGHTACIWLELNQLGSGRTMSAQWSRAQ
jgi:hypothetical protein